MQPPTALDQAGMSQDIPVLAPTLGESAAGRCRRRIHLDFDPAADRSARLPLDDGTRHRLADREAHLDRVRAALRTAFPDAPSGAEALRALRAGTGAPVLLDVTLRSGHRAGSAAALIRAGDGYVPVIVRSHRTTDPGAGAVLADLATPLGRAVSAERKARAYPSTTLALSHLMRLLADLGRASTTATRGGVIGRGAQLHRVDGIEAPGGPDDADVIVWHDLLATLPEYDARFADRLAIAIAASTGAPALAEPRRIGECRRCSWWELCQKQLKDRQDVTLIATGQDADLLLAGGIGTVPALAAATPVRLTDLGLTGDVEGLRTRARAWLSGAPMVRRQGEIRVPRADLELDVDMESYLEDGAYLWGTYLSGPGVRELGLTPGYRAFATWRPLPDADEGRSFAEFWAYLSGLRRLAAERGKTFAAYCYSRQAEERWLFSTPLRYPDVPGMPTAESVADWCAGPQWVDIYQQIREQFVIPGTMKLKALAPVAGFTWRDADPGGENSMAWYRAAAGFDGPPDEASRQRVLHYNEDDVRATLALREWMTHHAGTMPTVAELDARQY